MTDRPEALHATDRTVLRIAGPDARDFLQGLVTNDVRRLDAGSRSMPPSCRRRASTSSTSSSLPTAPTPCSSTSRPTAPPPSPSASACTGCARSVAIAADRRVVVVGAGEPPPGAFADPRDPALGWRALVAAEDAPVAAGPGDTVLAAARVARGVPETGVELLPDDSYILELGFERLHGVDFRKGCYVGQEVTARMKHKAELRKGLARVRIEGALPPPGTAILAGDRPAGTLHTAADGEGLAYLRFDRAEGPLTAGGARLTRLPDGP